MATPPLNDPLLQVETTRRSLLYELQIPANGAGLIEYRCHPFWSQKYCPEHVHDNTARCCSCERLEVDYQKINQQIPDCEAAIKECGTSGTTSCEMALAICEQIFEDILDIAGNINYYDIRIPCKGDLCYDFSNMENFLSESSVKTALGVPSDIDFVSCSRSVYDVMLDD